MKLPALVRASGAGIKREGLLYFEKYSTGGPDTGLLVWSGLKCPFSASPERFSEMGS